MIPDRGESQLIPGQASLALKDTVVLAAAVEKSHHHIPTIREIFLCRILMGRSYCGATIPQLIEYRIESSWLTPIVLRGTRSI